MTTNWTAKVTFLSLSYNGVGYHAYDAAVTKFSEKAPYSLLWKESEGRYTTHFTARFTSRAKKNKVLRYLRKWHETDSNIQWSIVKKSDDYYDSDSSSDEYDWVHTSRSDTV